MSSPAFPGPASRDRNLPGPDTGYTATFGTGDPVTLFAHGFSGAIRDTRPFASGIPGTRALVNLGGHGGRPSPGPAWDYATIAAQLGEALEHTGATRALGVSMSAGGLARLVTQGDPRAMRLERIAFVLPASWAGFSSDVHARNTAYITATRRFLDTGNRDGLLGYLLDREPAEVAAMPPARAWAKAKVDALFDTDMSDGLTLAGSTAVENPAAAADFAGEVLVLTHEDDLAHPESVARQYAEAFGARSGTGTTRLEVLPPGSILWRGRSRVKEILMDFFAD